MKRTIYIATISFLLMYNHLLLLLLLLLYYFYYYYYYYYYYYNVHQLYFCYGKVELLRGSFLNYGAVKFPSAAEYVRKSYFLGN